MCIIKENGRGESLCVKRKCVNYSSACMKSTILPGVCLYAQSLEFNSRRRKIFFKKL